MINKERFVKFVEKYHLGGIIDSAVINVEDKTLRSTFKTLTGDLRGHVELQEFDLPDGNIGSYYTANLLKLLGILNNDVHITPGIRESDQFTHSLEFRDTKGKKVKYSTCELDIIESDGKKAKMSSYDVKISLNNEVIDDILKAYGALNSNITFLKRDDKLFVVFNYSQNNEDNIEIELETEELNEDFELMTFDAKLIKNVLEVNKRRYDDGYIQLSMKGIAQFYFMDNDSTAEYWIVKLQD